MSFCVRSVPNVYNYFKFISDQRFDYQQHDRHNHYHHRRYIIACTSMPILLPSGDEMIMYILVTKLDTVVYSRARLHMINSEF